ncbi:hypothetical protein L63ED372_03145 [Limnohabitans sp. 63ED37-2]|nr:hypothetical protein L63ED372_03145 [Limnohabitans sp. 63ED37-2]
MKQKERKRDVRCRTFFKIDRKKLERVKIES